MIYGEYMSQHKPYVVGRKDPPLLGCDWLQLFHLDWTSIHLMVNEGKSQVTEKLINMYSEVFQDGLWTNKSVRAHLILQVGASPHFNYAHTVSFVIREGVGIKLDQLEEAGILRKVDHIDIGQLPLSLFLKRTELFESVGTTKCLSTPCCKWISIYTCIAQPK